jgi:flavin-dependent dehydrogenase
VGGGPAGLAAAIALRTRGADVLVVDALKPPIDKACGEGLMPDARRDLAALGIYCESNDGAVFRGIRFVEWSRRAPISASANFKSADGIGVRRTVLHYLMMERALETGVRFRWNTHAVLGNRVLLNGEECCYRYLVGADGQRSKVRKWAGLDTWHLSSRRYGFRRHYRVEPFSDAVEVHWCALGQVYITPVAQSEICVAVITQRSTIRMQQVLDAVPNLRERLSAVDAITEERGAVTTTRTLQCVARNNVALIGDASGSVDAVTGEGLAISFRQANLLARSLQQDSLHLYAAEHEKTLERPRRMARALLVMDEYAWARTMAIRALAASPALFRRLLQAHVGEERLPGIRHRGTARGFNPPTSGIERAST